MNEDLLAYVRRQLSKGSSPDQIRLRLLQAGYDKETAYEHLSLASKRKDEHLRNALIVVAVVFLLVVAVLLYVRPKALFSQEAAFAQQPGISQESKLSLQEKARQYVLLGKTAIGRLDEDEAMDVFRNASSFDQNNSEAHYFLGHLLFAKGKLSEAEIELKRTIEIAPKAAKAYTLLGSIYFLQQNFQLSEDMFTKSLAITPNSDAYDGLGWIRIHTHKYDEALEYFNLSNDLHSTTEEPLVGLGYSYYYLRDNKLAIAYFEQALWLNPTNSMALNGLALCYINETDYDRAFSSVGDAMRFDNNTPSYYLTLAKLFYLTNDKASAKKYIDKYFGFNDLDLYQKQEAELLRQDIYGRIA